MRRRLQKKSSSKSGIHDRDHGRSRMSLSQAIGLAGFTAAFGAALIFAFNSSPVRHDHRQDSGTVAISNAVVPTSTGPLDPGRREQRRAYSDASYGDQDRWDSATPGSQVRFEVCGKVRRNCVVDGDTFWFGGEKVRIADIDTPEIHQPHCIDEHRLGLAATSRLVELLNEGSFELRRVGGQDVDRYGRRLRLVVRNDLSLGDQLVSEGLAHEWLGRKVSWCN